MKISELCTPAMIYFLISAITLIISIFTNFNIMSLIIKGFFIIVWSIFLNYLCSKGYKIVSWVLLILPFFVMFR